MCQSIASQIHVCFHRQMQNRNSIYVSTTDNLWVITTLCNIFSYFQINHNETIFTNGKFSLYFEDA